MSLVKSHNNASYCLTPSAQLELARAHHLCQKFGVTISRVRLLSFLSILLLSSPSKATPISEGALSTISKIHIAAKQQDTVTIKALMVPEFIWSFGGDADAQQAIKAWKADNSSFKHLYTITGKKCIQKPDQSVECPRNASVGYRAGFKQTPEGWRMIYFVGGD